MKKQKQIAELLEEVAALRGQVRGQHEVARIQITDLRNRLATALNERDSAVALSERILEVMEMSCAFMEMS